ncbi:hypothetical protein VTO73DRAFT_12006 [Trametes versicolor]
MSPSKCDGTNKVRHDVRDAQASDVSDARPGVILSITRTAEGRNLRRARTLPATKANLHACGRFARCSRTPIIARRMSRAGQSTQACGRSERRHLEQGVVSEARRTEGT